MKTLTGEHKKVFKKSKKLNRGLYLNNFSELFPNGKHRFEIPISNIDYKNSKSFKIIENYLKQEGYEITDYIKGHAFKKNDKNIYKIGKIIKNNTYISKKFRDCVFRQKHKLIISRHPYDIACASWEQDWESCLNFENGMHRKYLNEMIMSCSCLITYLVSATKNTNLGRIFIFPYYDYKSGDYWLFTSDTGYGLFPKECKIFLREWLNKNYNEKYVLPRLLSDDILVNFRIPENLVYDNYDKRKLTVFNENKMCKYKIRKLVNENTIEKYLKSIYNCDYGGDGLYGKMDLIHSEIKKWYEYHNSYGRNKNCREMKNKKFLLYWIENSEPEENEVSEYLNYLYKNNLKINKSNRIQKWVLELKHQDMKSKITKYLNIVNEKIDWDDGKNAIFDLGKVGIIKSNGVAQKRLLEYFN